MHDAAESVPQWLRSPRWQEACRSLVSPLLDGTMAGASLLNPTSTVTLKGGHDLLPIAVTTGSRVRQKIIKNKKYKKEKIQEGKQSAWREADRRDRGVYKSP